MWTLRYKEIPDGENHPEDGKRRMEEKCREDKRNEKKKRNGGAVFFEK
jgi:hypothetical protein